MSDLSLSTAWRALRARGRTALIPYLTAGHPTPGASLDALRRVAPHADIIEVGVPFSDPLADGPVIQRSTFTALQQGMTLAGTLALVAEAKLGRPVVLFSYLNPIRRYGLSRFLQDAERAGVTGLLLTDLPAGGDPEVEGALAASPLDLIRLIAPTTPAARVEATLAGARGFVYVVARLGVTGMSAGVATDLGETVARVRAATDLPIAVGFGISTADQARQVARLADGVVVGSALVDRLERDGPAGAEAFIRGLRVALDEGAA
ncbi:MAG: tryptophan synthase subunit alpha [Gemmatimonadetes bacterium]|nr:tryptophan synthase subunit alpha [Gemmatimonadota bacterium]